MSRKILSNSFAESDYSWQMTQDSRIEDLENADPPTPPEPTPSEPTFEQLYYNPDPSAEMSTSNTYIGTLDADELLVIVCAYNNDDMADYSTFTVLPEIYMQSDRQAVVTTPYGYRSFTYSVSDNYLTWDYAYATGTVPPAAPSPDLIIPIYVYKVKISIDV